MPKIVFDDPRLRRRENDDRWQKNVRGVSKIRHSDVEIKSSLNDKLLSYFWCEISRKRNYWIYLTLVGTWYVLITWKVLSSIQHAAQTRFIIFYGKFTITFSVFLSCEYKMPLMRFAHINGFRGEHQGRPVIGVCVSQHTNYVLFLYFFRCRRRRRKTKNSFPSVIIRVARYHT